MMQKLGEEYAAGEITKLDLKPQKKIRMAALVNKHKGENKPKNVRKRPASATTSAEPEPKVCKKRPAAAPSGGEEKGKPEEGGGEGGGDEEGEEEEGEDEPEEEDCLAEAYLHP